MRSIDVCCAILTEHISGRPMAWAARKGPGSHLAGLWEFPGGKIETNETAEEALHREIREELGVNMTILAKLTPSQYDYGTHSVILHPFIARITDKTMPRPIEHMALALMEKENLRTLRWAPADIPILRQYLSRQST